MLSNLSMMGCSPPFFNWCKAKAAKALVDTLRSPSCPAVVTRNGHVTDWSKEKKQETGNPAYFIIFHGKIYGFRLRFSLTAIHFSCIVPHQHGNFHFTLTGWWFQPNNTVVYLENHPGQVGHSMLKTVGFAGGVGQ